LSTDNVYVPQQGALNDLENWIAGDLGSCRVRLYISNTPFLPTRVVADYTEASFTGYAPIVGPAWGAPFVNGGGQAETDTPTLTWHYTAGSGTATVFGVFVTDSSGAKLLLVVPFQNPEVLSPAINSLNRVLQVTCISQL